MKPDSNGARLVSQRMRESAAVKQQWALDADAQRTIASAGQAFITALRAGHKLIFFGNGGSAADAQHLAAELTGRYLRDRTPLAAIALTVNTSSLTAIANDYGFEHVFARGVEALGHEGDVAIGISTSGSSSNVVRAIKAAKARGLVTVALTGRTGGQLRDLVDFCICVPSDETPRIQECHILAGHILCEIVEQGMFGD